MEERICIAHGKGRLGNIMFSLATGLYYSRMTGRRFYYLYDPEDIEHYNDYYNRELNYGIFHKIDVIKDLDGYDAATIDFKREVHATYSPLSESPAPVVFIDGWRLNPRYFTRDFAIEIFGPGNDILEYIRNLYPDVDFENSVSINVRRGDYLEYVGMGYVVNDMPFYRKVFENYPADQKYVVTSDDIEWCKDVFQGENFTFIDKQTFRFQKMWVDLYVQGLCKDNIISNSTFSWWGAFLNPHKDRKVYYQYPFYKNERNDGYTYDAILPDDRNWIPIYEIDMMKVAVVTPVKHENRYLREWVEYYKNLGVDNIILYDNNGFMEESVLDVISDYAASGFVKLADMRQQQVDVSSAPHIRQIAGQRFYEEYGNDYDWICCFGVDEYLEMEDYDNIKKYLAYQTKFSMYDVIVLNQKLYDDNGAVRYEDAPLRKRFTHRCTARFNGDDMYVRCIVKGKLGPDRINFVDSRNKYNPHNFAALRKNACCDSAGNEMEYLPEALDRIYDPSVISKKWLPDFSRAYVVHYKYKTIEEYCWKIIDREPGIFNAPNTYKEFLIDMFFQCNACTPEKDALARELLKCVTAGDVWDRRQDKIAVCALTVRDNEYLQEWVSHYKTLGVDAIYLYDFNKPDYQDLHDVIGDDIDAGFVTVINWRGKIAPQWLAVMPLAFHDFNTKYSDMFAWTCYFETDEFFTFTGVDSNIHDFLNDRKFDGFAIIGVNCWFYNDGDLYSRTSGTVQQRFTNRISNRPLDVTMKSIVRSGCSTKINWLGVNEHYMPLTFRKQEKITADLHGDDIRFLDSTDNFVPSQNHTLYMEPTGNDIAVLKCYKWKTIEEYLDRIDMQLCTVGSEYFDDLTKDNCKELLLRFFDFNEPTKQKDRVINEWIVSSSLKK